MNNEILDNKILVEILYSQRKVFISLFCNLCFGILGSSILYQELENMPQIFRAWDNEYPLSCVTFYPLIHLLLF